MKRPTILSTVYVFVFVISISLTPPVGQVFAASFQIDVNPKGSFTNGGVNDIPTIIDLAAIGIQPGMVVGLERVGAYSFSSNPCSSPIGYHQRSTFSSTNELLAPGADNRVPGAIDTGLGASAAPYTIRHACCTDIDEYNGVTVQVPENASYLFVMSADSIYSDNQVHCSAGVYAIKITASPEIYSITPNHGGDTGDVTLTISGIAFGQDMDVRLSGAGPDILAQSVTINNSGTTISARFDLTGKPQGLWNIVVSNSTGFSQTFPQAFTIEEGRSADVWVDIVGRDTIRVGRPQRYTILFGNTGNVDAPGAYVTVGGIPIGSQIRANTNYIVSLLGETTTLTTEPAFYYEPSGELAVPFEIDTIPPDGVGQIELEITTNVTSPFELTTEVIGP